MRTKWGLDRLRARDEGARSTRPTALSVPGVKLAKHKFGQQQLDTQLGAQLRGEIF